MLLVPCMHCFTAVRVMGEPQEVALVGEGSEFWPDKYVCVQCERPCEGIYEGDAEQSALEKMKLRELTAQEFYAALNGLGTPDEMHCDTVTVRELFSSKTVRRVHSKDVRGTTRSVIESIEFDDGTRLYLAAAPLGAVVYRITRPISYTQKVLNGTP